MKKIGIYILGLLASNLTSFACTNFIVTPGASIDGSAMVTYAADAHVLFGELYFWPAASFGNNDSLDVYEWDTGKPLGKIKQTNETYKVVGNMNEHQVVIGETTFTGREELQDTTGRIDYGSLMYITLQRAKSAREAIHTIDTLLREYGYYSTGESFSIADPNEVWIFEMIGKGPENKGIVWVALKIPDGYISGHANHARITTFPLNDPENCLFAPDVISFARDKGYFEGHDSAFSFSDVYNPLDFAGARFCEARVWSGFRKVALNMEQYEQYAMGYDLKNRMPLWVKPVKKLSVNDVMGIMRDYYQDTKMDMTMDVGGGPYSCIVRWRPLTWEVDSVTYFNERAISTQQTGFSFVSQSRKWLPNSIGGILWFGVDDTYSTVYNPIYCGITEVPENYAVGNGSIMEFSDNAAFWVFNQVSNLAYTRYSAMIPEIQELQRKLEKDYISKVSEIDAQAANLYKKSVTETLDLLTAFSVNTANGTVDHWKGLYKHLFVKYMDGNVKTSTPLPKGQYYIPPKVEQPGYGSDWYKKIIEETGDKFLIKEQISH